MIRRDDATETQIRAAHPRQSTWVEANAGSGKTRVLTDRVARLLLEGVQPQHILCLTYTKAAASEMQNRLFKRLGEWAMLDSAKLTLSLQELGIEQTIDDAFLARSRRLFAQAIEAPGGLKIQTIHSFCAALLRRFPLEAGVSPQFTEIEDRAAILLRKDVLDDMVLGKDLPLVQDLTRHFTGEDLTKLTAEILRHRDTLLATDPDQIDAGLGVPQGQTPQALLRQVNLGSESALLAELVPVLLASGPQDQTAGARLSLIDLTNPSCLTALEGVFLYGKDAKAGPFTAKVDRFPTKSIQKNHSALMPDLHAWMRRVEAARPARLALQAAQKSRALLAFADSFIRLYDSRKQALGYLDFDDLIRRARTLLTDPAVAQWVLFRLDGGIDHILVDEAQDTSPIQWDVIELLAQEFTSGQSARSDVPRTLFVVGDKKQSIYSFQGADPGAFDQMRQEFSTRLSAIGQTLQNEPLLYSFRSSPAILNMVDHTFGPQHQAAIGQPASHEAFKMNMPGRVDLWPAIEPTAAPDDSKWYDPVDTPGPQDHRVVLARKIADEIQRLLSGSETIPAEIGNTGTYHRRPIQPQDILILVRGRTSGIFNAIIQACKERKLPIAGADRLKVAAELAVKDIAALLSFLALQEDDLSLAAALRSPLFGFSEQQLFTLAHGRGRRKLWEVLRSQHQTHAETLSVLNDLRDRVDFLRPYELIERILTKHNGRARLLARLGPEAEDGIDALLAQALAYESISTPSLTGFLVWMQQDELTIKRQIASDGGLIRVMTVHGAKGLEAPIVILPDTTPPKADLRDEILTDDQAGFWKTPVDDMPPRLTDLRDAALTRANHEYLRLLYVAMTRAEKWLIVAGAGDMGKDRAGWYDIVAQGMTHAGGTAHDFPTGRGWRYATGDWTGLALQDSSADSPVPPPELPGWAKTPAPTPPLARKTLSPSTDLGGAKALPSEQGLDETTAKLYGTAVHLLLEHLPDHPPAARADVAATLLAHMPQPLPGPLSAQAVTEALTLLDTPTLAPLFAPTTLAEVSLTAPLGPDRLHGTIDRLIVTDTTVTAVDFKTNRAVPNRPENTPLGLLRQMGAYAHALRLIYPDKEIQTAILWTATGNLMPFPEDVIATALQSRDPA